MNALRNKKRTRRIFKRNLNLYKINLKKPLVYSVYKKFVLAFIKTIKNLSFGNKTLLAS